jgi:tetratricopeptide (TPR) repeat protein
LSDEKLYKTLEEAKKAAVIEERAGVGVAVTYRFAHAFFRQTLYEETIAPRRIRLHQQVARALEEIYASRLEEHAAELAEHFSHSSDSADLKKAVSYGEMAAKRANDVYAYGEAVRLLDQAIKVQNVLNPDDKGKICDMLLDLCDVLSGIPEYKRIIDKEAPSSFSLAESLGDGARAARACILILNAIGGENPTVIMNTSGILDPSGLFKWIERLDGYAQPGTAERAMTDAWLGLMKSSSGEMQEGQRLLNQSLKLARSIGEQDTILMVSSYIFMGRRAPQFTEERTNIAEELWSCLQTLSKKSWSIFAFQWAADTFFSLGQRQRAEDVCDKLRKLAQVSGNILFESLSAGLDSVLALIDGHIEDALNISENIWIRSKEAGVADTTSLWADQGGIRARIYMGKSLETFEKDISVSSRVPSILPAICLLRALLGRKEEALEMLEKYVTRRPDVGTFKDLTNTWRDILFLEAGVETGHRQVAELLMNRFKGTALKTTGMIFPTCIPRHLGGAAALLGRYDEARKYYQEAVKICTEMRFRPELALSRLQLAELLLEHYPMEKKEALEHLDFAIKEFREMKMQPSLERALRHKDILKA